MQGLFSCVTRSVFLESGSGYFCLSLLSVWPRFPQIRNRRSITISIRRHLISDRPRAQLLHNSSRKLYRLALMQSYLV